MKLIAILIILVNCTSVVNGEMGFCYCHSCSENEGDCDSNEECQDGLACGSKNCHVSLGFANDTDCCYMPALGDEHFCTPINTCGDNEGDCDSSDECRNNYFCGSNNCPDSLGFGSDIDCCFNTSHLSCMFPPFEYQQRIVGGISAVSPIPWQVLVVINNMYHCGGTILDDMTILSAAHCFENPDSPSYIRAGSLQVFNGGQVGLHLITSLMSAKLEKY